MVTVGIPIDQSAGEVVAGIAKLTAIVLTIKPDRPWDHLLAGYWDSITFKDWIDRTVVTADAKLLFSLICSSTLSVGSDEISALFMFNYIAEYFKSETADSAVLRRGGEEMVLTVDGAGNVAARPLGRP